MGIKEQLAAVMAIIPWEQIPQGRTGIRPETGYRLYRGKKQFVVGYTWHKAGAHYASGRVYEAVLGWGPTFESALARARWRVER